MKNKLRVFIMMFMLLGITACGSKDAEQDDIGSLVQIGDFQETNGDEVGTPAPTEQPTPAPTPEPTATPEPERTIEITEATALEIAIPEGYNIVNGCGGVIITEKDGIYGAINYAGEMIVTNGYNYYVRTPNEQGYFVLGQKNDSSCVAHVFGVDGNEELVIDNIDRLSLHGDKILYTCREYDYETDEECGSIVLYDMLTNQVLFQEDSTWDSEEPGGFIPAITESGEFWYTNLYEPGTVNRIIVASESHIAEKVQAFEDDYVYIWSAFSEDFAMASSVLTGISMLTNENRTELYKYDLYDIWNSGSVRECQYFDNGSYKYNKGKMFVVSREDTEEGKKYYHLLDFEKATSDNNNWVQNYEEMIVATYDYIQLSDSPYYLAGSDGKYFYIDSKGQVVHDTFLDYSAFYSGYAMIIDTDGCAYVIDEKFNKVAGGYEADGVSTIAGVFSVTNDEERIYLTVQENVE